MKYVQIMNTVGCKKNLSRHYETKVYVSYTKHILLR